MAEYARKMTDIFYQFVNIAWYWVLLVMPMINFQTGSMHHLLGSLFYSY